MIKLGGKYKDVLTGFEGVVSGYVQYLTGCNQALLTPPVGPDGALREPHWFDEQRLVATSDEIITLNNGTNPGFDKPAPKR